MRENKSPAEINSQPSPIKVRWEVMAAVWAGGGWGGCMAA